MPEELIAPAASPGVEAETPELEDGLLSDDQLKAIFGETEETPDPSETPTEKPDAEEAETPKADEATESVDLTALDELDKAEPAKPVETPATADSEYLTKAKALLPNEETLGWAIDALQRTTAAAQAAEKSDFKGLIEALPFMRTFFGKALNDYVSANEDRIVEAYIQKHDPAVKKDPAVVELQQKVARFESREAQNERVAMESRQRTEAADRVKAIDTEITSLFDKVKFTSNAADRKFVTAAIKVALSENNEVFQKVVTGKTAAMRPIFSKVVKEYVEADKARMTTAAKRETANNSQKPILGGGSAQVASDGKLDAYQRAANFIAGLQRSKR